MRSTAASPRTRKVVILKAAMAPTAFQVVSPGRMEGSFCPDTTGLGTTGWGYFWITASPPRHASTKCRTSKRHYVSEAHVCKCNRSP